MNVIGLTGGIGSGKSTVARMFAARGAHVIDADLIARQVVEPGSPTLAALVEAFGGDIVDEHGHLARQRLAEQVFASDELRGTLERITHPEIRRRIDEAIAAARRDASALFAVVDHPLIIETDQVANFDALMVVIAPMAHRVERLVTQRGMDPVDVQRRIAAQTDDATRRVQATWIIDNDGDLDDLERRAHAVFDAVVSWVSSRGSAG